MSGIGIVWVLLLISLSNGLIATSLFANAFSFNQATLVWGVVSGLFSACANVMLIKGMTHQDVGICSAIYRLNLAPAAVMAFFLLGEPVTFWKLLGLSAAVLAVFLFYTPVLKVPKSQPHSQTKRKRFGTAIEPGLVLVVVASLMRAVMGVSYKWGLICGAQAMGVLIVNGIIWAIVGLIYWLIWERPMNMKIGSLIPYCSFSGCLVFGIVLFMMLALKQGQASIVLPITQLSFLLTAVIGIVWLNEPLSHRKVAGVICCLVCIFLLTVSL